MQSTVLTVDGVAVSKNLAAVLQWTTLQRGRQGWTDGSGDGAWAWTSMFSVSGIPNFPGLISFS